MKLTKARDEYKRGQITFEELHNVFFENASKDEISRFWNSPVYDRAGVIIGKTKGELDSEWNKLLKQ